MTFEEIMNSGNLLNPYGQHLGINIVELDNDHCVALLEVQKELLNPHGMLHGGAYYSLADTAAGVLSRTAGRKNVTLEGKLNFIKSAAEGETIKAIATKMHQGNTTGVYLVNIIGKDEKLLATGIFTMYYIK
ncbi:PaaI family thioesterase [Fusobacterium sp. PH5-44]|uniref:PaaI family thioesterase n=1 Tax=unclassified Fusobacterium TaxID=2648384 RepID=UPI003D22408F